MTSSKGFLIRDRQVYVPTARYTKVLDLQGRILLETSRTTFMLPNSTNYFIINRTLQDGSQVSDKVIVK